MALAVLVALMAFEALVALAALVALVALVALMTLVAPVALVATGTWVCTSRGRVFSQSTRNFLRALLNCFESKEWSQKGVDRNSAVRVVFAQNISYRLSNR